jgi:hypothetical protein
VVEGNAPVEKSVKDLVARIFSRVDFQLKKSTSNNRVIKAVQPQTIILKLEGKELLRFVNKNLLEINDAIY